MVLWSFFCCVDLVCYGTFAWFLLLKADDEMMEVEDPMSVSHVSRQYTDVQGLLSDKMHNLHVECTITPKLDRN